MLASGYCIDVLRLNKHFVGIVCHNPCHPWLGPAEGLISYTYTQLSVIYVPVISNALFIFVPENREE